MLAPKQLLSQTNLNNAFLSKTTPNTQGINGNLQISGGQMNLKVSYLSDNLSSAYLQINPQGAQVIIYDGVNNQKFSVFSKSGSENTYMTTINGSPSYGLIDVIGIDHLEINTTSGKPVNIGGQVNVSGSITLTNPSGANQWSNSVKFHSTDASGNVIESLIQTNNLGDFKFYNGKSGIYSFVANTSGYVGTIKNQIDDGNGNAITVGTKTVNGSLHAFGGANYVGVGTATNTATNAGVIGFMSNGVNGNDGAYIEYFPPASGNTGTNTANILSISSQSATNLSQLRLMANDIYPYGTLYLNNANARLVLPVGANMYATS